MLLLTNDDGIEAEGLEALAAAVDGLDECVRVAPRDPWSNGSHAVTTHRPIRVTPRQGSAFVVEGTPVDCVRIAIASLGLKPAWVLSGINHGGNLGTDVWPSGTMAAAREAAVQGLRAMALSHYRAEGQTFDWNQAARWTREVLELLWPLDLPSGTVWNVNLPHLPPGSPTPEIVFCPIDPSPLPLAYEPSELGLVYSARYQSRPRLPDHDVAVCFSGRISVSRVWARPHDAQTASPGPL